MFAKGKAIYLNYANDGGGGCCAILFDEYPKLSVRRETFVKMDAIYKKLFMKEDLMSWGIEGNMLIAF